MQAVVQVLAVAVVSVWLVAFLIRGGLYLLDLVNGVLDAWIAFRRSFVGGRSRAARRSDSWGEVK